MAEQPPPHPFVTRTGLHPVGRTDPLPTYLARTWAARDFVLALATSQTTVLNSRARLGALWLLLGPFLEGLAYFLIFGLLLGTGRGVPNFVGYLIVGIFVFRFTSGTLTSVSRSVERNRKLAQALVLPRLVLPLAAAARELVSFVPALAVMLGIVWIAPPAERVTPALLLVLPVTVLASAFGLGVGLVVARLTVWLPDVGKVLPFLTRIWLFVSAVFYGIERFDPGSTLFVVLTHNPAYVYLSLAREAVLLGQVGAGREWAVGLLWSVGALASGVLVFRTGEARYGSD